MWPFKCKPNDWAPIFVAEPDQYTVFTTIAGTLISSSNREVEITHTLYYSKSRNKYRIEFSGYPVTHREVSPSYIACVKKQIELQNKQTL